MATRGSSKVVLGALVLALAAATALGGRAPAAQAQDGGGRSAWSAERLRDARPKPLPELRAPAPNLGVMEIPPAGESVPARPPTVDPGGSLDQRLYRPQPDAQQRSDAERDDEPAFTPQAAGLSGASFTQSRVFPPAAVRVFPYRAIGKLFAHDPGLNADFTCTAFVVERRVVATAGHCVFDFVGRTGSFARDFVFIPAFDRGRAPFGVWTGSAPKAARSWQLGDGTVPNPADFGVITVADRRIDGEPVAIADVVGRLGWQLQVAADQVAILGYPGNLDQAQRMQQTHTGLFEVIPPNAIEFGSAQGGGSSGGPIVEDFGNPAVGQPQTANRVVSLVSFGTDGLWTLGGSLLNQEFAGLIQRACRQRRGNCYN